MSDLVQAQVLPRLLVDLLAKVFEGGARSFGVEREIFRLAARGRRVSPRSRMIMGAREEKTETEKDDEPEDVREILRQQPPKHQVRVRDGQVPVLAVTYRSRMSGSRLGTGGEHAVAPEKPRAAPGGNGVDRELRGEDGDPGGSGFEDGLCDTADQPQLPRLTPEEL